MDTQANEQQLTPEESYVKAYTEAHAAYGIILLAVAVACAAGIFAASPRTMRAIRDGGNPCPLSPMCG